MVEELLDYAKNLAEELRDKTLGEFAREKGCRVEDVLEKIYALRYVGIIKDVKIVFIG
jgi:hypothetical protein